MSMGTLTPPLGGVNYLLAELCVRADVPGIMLERDDRFPPDVQRNAELDAIAAAVFRGAARRAPADAGHPVPEGREYAPVQ